MKDSGRERRLDCWEIAGGTKGRDQSRGLENEVRRDGVLKRKGTTQCLAYSRCLVNI